MRGGDDGADFFVVRSRGVIIFYCVWFMYGEKVCGGLFGRE